MTLGTCFYLEREYISIFNCKDTCIHVYLFVIFLYFQCKFSLSEEDMGTGYIYIFFFIGFI